MVVHKVLFVCMGNICRSPMAEGVFRKRVTARKMDRLFHIDSAGTESWHQGKPPDMRAQSAALRRGIDLSDLRARVIVDDDFNNYDLILVMDSDNLANLNRLDPQSAHKIKRLLMFFPDTNLLDVPDPYYGDQARFETALDLIEPACVALLESLLNP